MKVRRAHRFQAAVSVRVPLKARVNFAEKFGDPELLRSYEQLAAQAPEVVPPPCPESIGRCASLVAVKDVHVLAAALECGVAYLLTLGRRHLMAQTVMSARLPLQVMTPGDFLRQIASQESL